MLLGLSGDDRWIFFAVDPGGSASMAVDGLTLRVVSAAGGGAFRLKRMLLYPDYLAWCGGRLFFVAGVWRVATDHKRLFVAAPPNWRPRPYVGAAARSFGSLACAPSGRWLVAQSQPQSDNPSFFATHWALWRIGVDGSMRQLTIPPLHHADESPRFAPDGSLLFVRSRQGRGKLFALRRGRLLGPLLSLGYSLGYYGHHAWWSR
jgi:hypothetical protein